jgi:hypothetical protein
MCCVEELTRVIAVAAMNRGAGAKYVDLTSRDIHHYPFPQGAVLQHLQEGEALPRSWSPRYIKW